MNEDIELICKQRFNSIDTFNWFQLEDVITINEQISDNLNQNCQKTQLWQNFSLQLSDLFTKSKNLSIPSLPQLIQSSSRRLSMSNSTMMLGYNSPTKQKTIQSTKIQIDRQRHTQFLKNLRTNAQSGNYLNIIPQSPDKRSTGHKRMTQSSQKKRSQSRMANELVFESPNLGATGFNNNYQTHDNTRPGSRQQRLNNTAKRSRLTSIMDFKGIFESTSRQGHELIVNQF